LVLCSALVNLYTLSAMADNGGSSRGGGRGGRGGGSTRGGGARSRRGRGGSSRQQGGPTASTTGGGRRGGGGNNTPVYRAIGDETTDKIGREVSELVMSSRPDDCSKLEALLAQTHKQHPKRLQTVLHRNTTFCFPQGHMLAAACSNGKVAAADLLLRYGVEPNKQCPSGSTALSLACYTGRTACVKLLLGLPGSLRGPAVAGVRMPSRASPRVAPAYGANALIHACRCTNEKAAEEMVGALLEADPSLPLEAAEGALALHAAAASGFPRVLERLLKSNDQLPDDQRETQLGWINNDNLCALQVAEKKCETEMQREREKQAQASRAPRPQGGGGGQQQQQQQRRGANNGGGSRGGRGRRNGARGGGGGGNSKGGVLEGGWGCVVVLVRASANGIRNALHGSLSLKTDVVRDRLLSFLGLNALVKDIRKQRDEVEKAGGNADVADDFSDYTMSVLTHVSAMYKVVLKLPRSALQGPQQSTTSRLLVEV
ncbi:unnamed protein product, partial [Ectocarpus sp. 8 AP-2014]